VQGVRPARRAATIPRSIGLGWLVLLVALLFAGAARAQWDAMAAPAEKAEADVTVKFQNRTLFTFRGSIGVFGPQQRAEAARERVRRIVEKGGPLVVSVEPRPDGRVLMIDGEPAFMILAEDVNPLLQETLEQLASRTQAGFEDAAAAYKELRSPAAILRTVVVSIVATAAFLALAWGLVISRRWLSRRIDVAVENAVGRLRGDIRGVLSPQALGGVLALIVRIAVWGVGLSAAYVWLTYVLAAIPYTRPWGLQLEGFLLETLGGIALAVVHAVPDLFVVVIIVLLTRGISRIFSAFFDGVESGRITFGPIDAFTAPMTRRLVTALLWVFALAMAYPYLPGSNTEAFKGVSVLVGLMVSLGASGVVGQAASGLILTYSHAFKPGEYVRIGDTEGTMTNIGMFATQIKTGLGELVVLPNSYVLANTTKNYSRAVPGTGYVMDTTVTIGYGTPWRQVHAMLVEAARRTPGVASKPPPRVAQTELSDFYVAYRLICYALPQEARERAVLMSELHARIQDVFNEYGVQIMSPHYLADPPQAQVVPKDQWYASPAERPADETPRT
jgi:small-conductance mechanosensitive channel